MFPSYSAFVCQQEMIAVVGMGFIGLPLAVLLGQKYRVLGYYWRL